MNNFFDNQRILNLIWKRKFHFVIVGIIAIVLSAVFSGPTFIKPKFKSVARIYPTNIWTLSNESETEQMLEIVNSNDIKLKMFDAFDLDKVYKISKDDSHYLTYMLAIYNDNVSASKTEYETVEIKVLDHDPQRASDMCDSIIHFYNLKVREMHRAKNYEMVEISKKGLNQKYHELDSIMVKLDTVHEDYGILDYKEQVPEVTRGYMNALATGRGAATDTKKIKDLYNSLVEEGTDELWLESRLNFIIGAIDSLTTQYELYLSEYQKNITYSHVVEYPFPADKKSYPVRWLIVAFSTVSAIFLALLVFLVLDYRKKE
ncbi:MAG TPA: Wzz/FepE/Etk N-terminal domain-containing protein [Draconibacterium sp.]|nr:Wzz/FepE/Etk N-terminal domain-containing protein [Draconibacterium sp.]